MCQTCIVIQIYVRKICIIPLLSKSELNIARRVTERLKTIITLHGSPSIGRKMMHATVNAKVHLWIIAQCGQQLLLNARIDALPMFGVEPGLINAFYKSNQLCSIFDRLSKG